jgi:hypothetical protein
MTKKALDVETSTNQTTVTTLHAARRSLELVGDRIRVGYGLEIPWRDSAYAMNRNNFPSVIINTIDDHMKPLPSTFLRDSYQGTHEILSAIPVWSKISNALKRLDFRSHNFLAQPLSETSRECNNPGSTIKFREALECFGRKCYWRAPT